MPKTPSSLTTPRYVVIFRTHFWDDFTSRQLARLQARVGSGDLFVLVDETRGHVSGIPTDDVFRLTDSEILAAGYVKAGEGSIQWYSGDVPLYIFSAAHPGYDYYVQIEYDAIVNTDLDDVVRNLAAVKADVVALRESGEDRTWHWRPTCLGFYEPNEITHLLICLSIYSSRALQVLAAKRLEHARRFVAGEVTEWPMCEGFVATESRRQGLVIRSLSEFGDVDAYRWWPPYTEREAHRLSQHAFIHPVLEQSRFVTSVLRGDFKPSLAKLVLPSSWIHKRLRGLGLTGYLQALMSKAYRTSLLSAIRRRNTAAARG